MQTKKSVVIWLYACIFLTCFMVLLGGYTRLSGSGLSMVDWRPISGILPPLSDQAWDSEFQNYQKTPEFQQVNFEMTVDGFKGIFLVEYFHRTMGRLLGLVFILPFLFFYFKNYLPPRIAGTLVVAFFLGGMQGALGWYMVKSGLIDHPMVSPLRLAAHLSLALLIINLLLRTAFRYAGVVPLKNAHFHRYSNLVLGVIICTIFYGALVAGHKAGLIYNTFPLMNGEFLPDDAWFQHPLWMNFTENPTMVQFMHRMFALFTTIVICALSYIGFRSKSLIALRAPLLFLMIAVFLQVMLGILTLLTFVSMHAALTHQMGALILFMIVTYISYKTSATGC